jgi:hypothetical protein
MKNQTELEPKGMKRAIPYALWAFSFLCLWLSQPVLDGQHYNRAVQQLFMTFLVMLVLVPVGFSKDKISIILKYISRIACVVYFGIVTPPAVQRLSSTRN